MPKSVDKRLDDHENEINSLFFGLIVTLVFVAVAIFIIIHQGERLSALENNPKVGAK